MCRPSRVGGRIRSVSTLTNGLRLSLLSESSDIPTRRRLGRLAVCRPAPRLALIRALMVQPKVLLLDEPTAALDAASVAAVESLIATRVRAGLAVLWVTHDAEQARRIARRLLVVKAGQVREEIPAWQATSP